MNVQDFLNKLDKVKSTGNGRWVACCPAHDDKKPSMNIKEAEDGRILIICRAGCQNYDILQAMGLEFKDLFVENFEPRKAFPAADVLAALENEIMIVSIIVDRFFYNKDISAGDWVRLRKASRRILKAADLTNGRNPRH